MKKNNILWAALSMTAALVMTACSSDDNDMTEAPVAPSTSKTIPYTVTVGGDEATTRATVDADNKTLKFASGDKLYITGTNIQGVLDLQDGVGASSNATFSGELTYTGEGSPADNLELTATLVSAQQTVGTQVSVDDAGAVTVNYPTAAYCATISDAVQQYSRLTGTSTYGDKAFTLNQMTAFLNFEITFEDGTVAGETLSAVVSNGGSTVCTANVTTATESEKVVAKFVLPVAAGTTLSSATVTMGSKAAISFGASQTLTGKVYNVRKTQAAPAPTYTMAANATAEDKGKLICTAGHIHAYNADAECTATRVAKIIYLGTTGHSTYTHGLALALTDEASMMEWQDAINACSAKNTSTPVTNATWLLASQAQWNYMLGTNGAGSYTALRDGFSSVGGSNLQSDTSARYWSSTAFDSDEAWRIYFYNGIWNFDYKDESRYVRACLAF